MDECAKPEQLRAAGLIGISVQPAPADLASQVHDPGEQCHAGNSQGDETDP
jgi:hypothetical protein